MATRDDYIRKLAEVSARFRTNIRSRLDDLDASIERLNAQGGEERLETLAELNRRFHEFAGTAPTLGFPRLGASARDLDRVTDEMLHQSCQNQQDTSGLRALFGTLRKAAEEESRSPV